MSKTHFQFMFVQNSIVDPYSVLSLPAGVISHHLLLCAYLSRERQRQRSAFSEPTCHGNE